MLVEFNESLVKILPSQFNNIQVGYAFGSQEVDAIWLEEAYVESVPAELQKAVFAFDWWIQNTDRTQINPNLLWQKNNQLIVIDHNNAFDPDFDANTFINEHIFAEQGKQLLSNFIDRDAWQDKFQAAHNLFLQAFKCAPDEWQWYDVQQTIPSNFDFDYCQTIINRCLANDFLDLP